jgi:hypothetical protein
VWVRADGDEAGMIEWIVVDFHFRELWIPYERTLSKQAAQEHRRALAEMRLDPERAATWVVEVDTDFVGHWPEMRGVFLLPLRHGWRKARWQQLARSLRVEVESDHYRDFRETTHRLRLDRRDFLEDIPEHLRWIALRRLIAIPWQYWRYPRGANTVARPYLYGDAGDVGGPPGANEQGLQFKSPGFMAEARLEAKEAMEPALPFQRRE